MKNKKHGYAIFEALFSKVLPKLWSSIQSIEALWVQWGTSNCHVIGQTSYYDVMNFVFVAKRPGRAAWQRTQNQ